MRYFVAILIGLVMGFCGIRPIKDDGKFSLLNSILLLAVGTVWGLWSYGRF